MMVAIREWMLLWPWVNFPKTPERLIDGTPVAKRAQTGKHLHSSMDHLATLPLQSVQTSDEELKEGVMFALTWPHATPDTPRKMLLTNEEEVIGNRNHNENPATKARPLSKERKAHIKHKMAINEKKFEEMRARGQPMVRWINIITKMEKMMEEYTFKIERESTRSMLKNLKGVQLDIQRVVRARFREWIGLGGRVFEPLQQEAVSKIPEKQKYELTDDLESTLKVTDDLSRNPKSVDVIPSYQSLNLQRKASSSIVSHNSNAKLDFERRLEDVQNWTEEKANESSVKAETKKLGDRENLTTRLTESHIRIVDDEIMESSFNYLVHILQDVTFKSWESDAPNWREYGEEIRATKLTFQRCILQIIQFMCKFELVGKGKLEGFLASNKTLDLMGDHVIDLFHVVQHSLYNRNAFLPDMEFLKNHWRTDYLQDIFEVMGKPQEAHFLSAALTVMAKMNEHFVVRNNETDLSNFIDDLVFKNRFFLRLENRAQDYPHSNPVPKEETDLKELGEKLIKIFQEPILIHGENYGSGYLLLYHILNYISTYHAQYMKSFFMGKEREFKTFVKELDLFRTGCKVSQIIRQGQTDMEIISFPNDEIYTMSKADAGRSLVQMKKDYEHISTSYKHLVNHFRQASKQDEKVKDWFEGYFSTTALLILFFDDRAISWEEGIKSDQIRRKWLRFEHKFKEGYELFPNLRPQLGPGFQSTNPKDLEFPTKEILNLWDPESLYI